MLKYNFFKITLGVLVVTLLGFVFLAFPDSSSAQVTKNVVIIMTDDQNVDSLPVMRKLMSFPEGSWDNFTNAIVNDSICCPVLLFLPTRPETQIDENIHRPVGQRSDIAKDQLT